MLSKFLSWAKRIRSSAKALTMLIVIPVVVAGFNIVGVLSGGFMAAGALTGIAISCGLCFAFVNLGKDNIIKVRDFLSGPLFGTKLCMSGVLDMAQLLMFTWFGFHLGGVILACALLYLSLNLSALFALLRIWACIESPEMMRHYCEETGIPTPILAAA